MVSGLGARFPPRKAPQAPPLHTRPRACCLGSSFALQLLPGTAAEAGEEDLEVGLDGVPQLLPHSAAGALFVSSSVGVRRSAECLAGTISCFCPPCAGTVLSPITHMRMQEHREVK